MASLLQMSYSKESDIKDILDDCIVEFVKNKNFENFSELFPEVEDTEVKNTG